VGAASLGWLFGGFKVVDDEWVMTSHRWLGTATAAWAVLTLAMCERVYRRAARCLGFRVVLFVGTALVGAEGFLGGSLVYGIDHYTW
jgi:heme A synthase